MAETPAHSLTSLLQHSIPPGPDNIGHSQASSKMSSIGSESDARERAVGERTVGAFTKFKQAFAGIKSGFKAKETAVIQSIDAKVADKSIVVRGLWSAAKLLYSGIKGVLTNKVVWGVGLIALGALCPWAAVAAIVVGVGLLVAGYGTYENTKETYQVAQMAGLSKGASAAFATAAFLLNLASTAAAFLTFGASAGISAKATSALQSAVNWFGTTTHAMDTGTHAMTQGVEKAAHFMGQATVNEIGKSVAGTGLIAWPAGVQAVKDHLSWRQDDVTREATPAPPPLFPEDNNPRYPRTQSAPVQHLTIATDLLKEQNPHLVPKDSGGSNFSTPVTSDDEQTLNDPLDATQTSQGNESLISDLSTNSPRKRPSTQSIKPLVPIDENEPQLEEESEKSATPPPQQNQAARKSIDDSSKASGPNDPKPNVADPNPAKPQRPEPPKDEPSAFGTGKAKSDSESSDDSFGPSPLLKQPVWQPPSKSKSKAQASSFGSAASPYSGGIYFQSPQPLKPIKQLEESDIKYYEFPKDIKPRNPTYLRQSRLLSQGMMDPLKPVTTKAEFQGYVQEARQILELSLKNDFPLLCESYTNDLDRLLVSEYFKHGTVEDCMAEAKKIIGEAFAKPNSKFRAAYLEIQRHPRREQLLKEFPIFDDKDAPFAKDAMYSWARDMRTPPEKQGQIADEVFARITALPDQ